ncbi:hypothetical protein E1B28_008200 [Marasmius oreades]|uniref:Uncharacterized protein n=1 Tax=Marasmius oreades TaxID=181124 RepID=A0A9P7RY20_9AGAR|nr:uncharacterized protein E1B28_008200 [Marasmius oreades]KAG7091797.1 hypothetical protein E1B28_008200 [Marasmius oreades]
MKEDRTDVEDNYHNTRVHAATSHGLQYVVILKIESFPTCFYKKKIANEIDTEPSNSAEELEIPKRFEESNLEDEGIYKDGDEEVDNDDDTFEDRFQGI